MQRLPGPDFNTGEANCLTCICWRCTVYMRSTLCCVHLMVFCVSCVCVCVCRQGDGVNDAPALKKADVGIAVAGATDAARGAADIVLTEAGLSTIVTAVIGARKIFQRMTTYAKYTISMTFRICFTFGLLTVIYDWCVRACVGARKTMCSKLMPTHAPTHAYGRQPSRRWRTTGAQLWLPCLLSAWTGKPNLKH